jgi:hypothetical protein
MGWFSQDKEPERFYLLPGMGGRASRRKHRIILIWAVVAGLLVSASVAALMYWMHNLGHSAH